MKLIKGIKLIASFSEESYGRPQMLRTDFQTLMIMDPSLISWLDNAVEHKNAPDP